MLKVMSLKEIVDFIEKMPFNKAYAAIANEYEYEESEDGYQNIKGEGWWSIIKLCYADAKTLLFDYFGGGYPLAYCIDGVQGEDTIENAVRDFLDNNGSMYGADELYVIDTALVDVKENES